MSVVTHVVADIVFAPTRSLGPSSLICICGESMEERTAELLYEAWVEHRRVVAASRNEHRSSLGPRVVPEHFDFGRTWSWKG